MRFKNLVALIAIFSLLMMVGCGGGSSSSSSGTTTASYVGTQTPGDYWSWIETTDSSGAVNFTAANNTKNFSYSGSESRLTGNSAGLSKLNITSSTDPNITTPTSAYKLAIPNTMVLAAMAPFYTFNHSGQVQLSIHGPVVAAAQSSCPTASLTNVNWIVMPNDNWCPASGSALATGTCTSASNAYGTAKIIFSGGAYAVTVTPYNLDGTNGTPVNLTSCTCSEGVIQCTDTNSNPVKIAFTPSGVFIMDTANYGLVGVVQPSSSITLTDFLSNGRTFKGMQFIPWDDYYDGCTTDSDCNNVYGISGGTCLNNHCGVPETCPISITADGTNLNALTYTNIDSGTLNTSVASVTFTYASQPSPGLITAQIISPTTGCTTPGTFPIVMAVSQINGKYVALVLSHTTCPTYDTPFNVLAIEQ